jgi:catechol 2,3-dioxygenase-like lactoylglutathione lyase family enzyme
MDGERAANYTAVNSGRGGEMTETRANPSTASDSAASLGRSRLSHISVPVRDRAEATRFFVDVLGAEITLQNRTFTEVRVAGTIIGFSEQTSGWTAPDAEFPHYAFEVPPEEFEPLKERLDTAGVKTHPIWTRHGVEALMYFRDPSGNLFELQCTEGFPNPQALRRAQGWGGDFRPPIADLSYDWKG